MHRTSGDIAEARAAAWDAEARDRERQAARKDTLADLSPTARRILIAQANVYRACAKDLRDAVRKVSRG